MGDYTSRLLGAQDSRIRIAGYFHIFFSERKDTHSISPGLVFIKLGSELVKSLITDAKLRLEEAVANTGLQPPDPRALHYTMEPLVFTPSFSLFSSIPSSSGTLELSS